MENNILILGASSEIGLALILQIQDRFDRVIAHYNSSAFELQALKEKIGDRLCLEQADFTSNAETKAFIDRISNRYQGITHIVHLPSGKISYARFPKKSWESVQRGMNIQLRSIYKILTVLLPPMVQSGQGKVVFVLSSCTVTAPRLLADYVTVKYALLGFMKSLAAEYADKGIQINAVSPSMIETKLLDGVPHLFIDENARANPSGHNAVTNDVIPMIAFLLSRDADFITGENILISGGGS
jgi:3-oxoacyl-[acyl-carrier protein] reductase